jgi:hypothetical protein
MHQLLENLQPLLEQGFRCMMLTACRFPSLRRETNVVLTLRRARYRSRAATGRRKINVAIAAGRSI